MEPHWFEDFDDALAFETPARVIADADIRAWAELVGDRNPLHLDDAYAAGTVFGGRIAPGLLGTAVASGLLNQSGLTAGTLVAFLGLEWRYRRPIRPGTAVRLRCGLLEARSSADPGRGVVRLALALLDDADEVVQDGTFTMLVKRRSEVDGG